MRKGGGALFMLWMDECNKELERCKATGALDAEVTSVEKARDVLAQTAMYLGGLGMQGDIRGAMFAATPFLAEFGNVVLALHSLWQARVAHDKLQAGADDATFYKGKMLNAKYYAANLLPQSIATGKAIQAGDKSALDDALFG
jgi:hypothetical protein